MIRFILINPCIDRSPFDPNHCAYEAGGIARSLLFFLTKSTSQHKVNAPSIKEPDVRFPVARIFASLAVLAVAGCIALLSALKFERGHEISLPAPTGPFRV